MNFTSMKAARTRSLMLATASVAAIGLAAPAHAQDSSLETVVVTGSHITTPGFQAPTPITSISSDYLQQTGTINGTQLIYELPQLIPNIAAQNAGVNAGQSTFNLRGLGSTRTLLLIDGKRLAPTSYDGTTDVNILPLSLVKRVDTVTAGASAAYGSDAIAVFSTSSSTPISKASRPTPWPANPSITTRRNWTRRPPTAPRLPAAKAIS